MCSQRRLVSVPGSESITWLWHVSRDECLEETITSSRITLISLRFSVAHSQFWASPSSYSKGSIHKVSQAPEAVGLCACGCYLSHPSSLISSQQYVTPSEVLVTLWHWVSRIHPYRTLFVLVARFAAVSFVCKGCNVSVYLCLSRWLEAIEVDLFNVACAPPTHYKTFKCRTKQISHTSHPVTYHMFEK